MAHMHDIILKLNVQKIEILDSIHKILMLQNVLKDSLSGPPKPLSHSVVGAASAASAGSLLSEKREFCY